MKSKNASWLAWTLLCLIPVLAFFSFLVFLGDTPSPTVGVSALASIGLLCIFLLSIVPGYCGGLFLSLYRKDKKDTNLVGIILAVICSIPTVYFILGPIAFYLAQRIKLNNT